MPRHRPAKRCLALRLVALCAVCAAGGCGDVGLVGGELGDEEALREAAGAAQRQMALGLSFSEGFNSKDAHEADFIAALDRYARPVAAGGIGHYPATATIWMNFASGGSTEGPRDTFPRPELLQALHERQITPMIFLTPVGPELSRARGDLAAARKYSNQAIANGAWDEFLMAFADGAAKWGKPIILRYAWEMNGSWFPWGKYDGNKYWALGNNPTNYRAAWKRVHEVIKSRAPKVRFFWCPFGTPKTTTKNLAPWFPDAKFVDYIGVDVYEAQRSDRSLVELYRPSIQALRGLDIPKKSNGSSKIPILIGETGILNKLPNRVRWLENGYAAVYDKLRDVKAIMYFDYNVVQEGRNWSLAAGRDMRPAYAKLARRKKFQGRFAPYSNVQPAAQQQPVTTPDQPEQICIAMGFLGCTRVSQCCGTGSNLTCSKAGKCCKKVGGVCNWNMQCCTGNCKAGRCAAAK